MKTSFTVLKEKLEPATPIAKRNHQRERKFVMKIPSLMISEKPPLRSTVKKTKPLDRQVLWKNYQAIEAHSI